MGGFSAKLAGGSFWDGFRNGAISAGLNHFAHALQEKNFKNLEDGIRRILANEKEGTKIESGDLKKYGVPFMARQLINSFTVKSSTSLYVDWNGFFANGASLASSAVFKDGIINVENINLNTNAEFGKEQVKILNPLRLTGGAIGINVNGKVDWDIYLDGNWASPDRSFKNLYKISE